MTKSDLAARVSVSVQATKEYLLVRYAETLVLSCSGSDPNIAKLIDQLIEITNIMSNLRITEASYAKNPTYAATLVWRSVDPLPVNKRNRHFYILHRHIVKGNYDSGIEDAVTLLMSYANELGKVIGREQFDFE